MFAVRLFLTVSVSGPGIVSGAGIDCPGSRCRVEVPAGTTVTLHAMPGAAATFLGWVGCPGTGDCTVTVNVQTSIQARFAPI